MKRIISALTILAIISVFYATVSAQTNELTFAIDILRHRQQLKKVSVTSESVEFQPEEFDKAFGLGKVEFIIITALPDPKDGILKLAGKDIEVGQGISRANIELIELIPINDKVKSSSFSFKCFGKEMVCEIVFAEGISLHPPQSTEIRFDTYKNVALYGSVLNNGENLSVTVTSSPKNGIIELVDPKTGSFIYQPKTNFCGKDEFKYKLADKYGLESEENSITVSVGNYDNLFLSDMYMLPEHAAAISLIKDGVMTYDAENVMFDPDCNISRSEFVEGLVKLCGYEPEIITEKTFFFDDADIPAEAKLTASAALDNGIFEDTFKDGKRMYLPDANITRTDAEAYISNVLINEMPEFALNSALYSDKQYVIGKKNMILASSGIKSSTDNAEQDPKLTRKEAAKMLYELRLILESNCPVSNYF